MRWVRLIRHLVAVALGERAVAAAAETAQQVRHLLAGRITTGREGGKRQLLVRVRCRLRDRLALSLRDTGNDYVDCVRNNELHVTGGAGALCGLQETHDHGERLAVHVQENMGVVRQRRICAQGVADVLPITNGRFRTFSSTRDEYEAKISSVG